MAQVKRKKKSSPIRQLLSPQKIAIPIVIGLAAATYLLITEVDFNAMKQIQFTWTSVLWLFVALIMVGFRDLGYMFRLRILSDKTISWRNVFDDIMLWEFSSAVTPSVVGGSGVAIFILNKEKLSVGRSTAVVMTTAFLDELFYALMVPLLFILLGGDNLFPAHLEEVKVMGITTGLKQGFWIGYGFILLLISLILFGIFISPTKFKNLLISVFKFPLLKRWASKAEETGDEVITTSAELRTKPILFWLKAFMATALSWTARYLVANFILMAFTGLSFTQNLVILARQLVMWVIMLISPTPGGAGIAEFAFKEFLSEFSPIGMSAVTLALIWRIYTYYPYLFLGAIILPRWIQRVYLKRKLIRFKN